MYSGKSSGLVLSGSLPISPLFCSLISVVSVVPLAFVLLVLNLMSSCFIVQLPGHLVNLIVLFFQLTSELCLTSQSWSKNISVLFKFVTAASSVLLCPLTLISRGATLVISPFFVPSALKTSNKKFISLVYILLFLTNCLSISVCVHLESTSALTLNFLLFLVFTSACMFNSYFPSLFPPFGITYSFWDFTWEISCTMPTWNLHQNSALYPCLYHLILPGLVISSSTVFFYSPLLYTLLCCIWSIF